MSYCPFIPLPLHLFTSFLSRSSPITPDVHPSPSQIQRLPFLQSSNLALDTLRGSDEAIGFEDILNGQDLIAFTQSLTQLSEYDF